MLAQAPLRRRESHYLVSSRRPSPPFLSRYLSSPFRASLTCGEQHRFVVYKLVGLLSRGGKERRREDAGRKKEKEVRDERGGRRGLEETERARLENLPLSFRLSFLHEYSPRASDLPGGLLSSRSVDRPACLARECRCACIARRSHRVCCL